MGLFSAVIALCIFPFVVTAQPSEKSIAVVSSRGLVTIPVTPLADVEMVPLQAVAAIAGAIVSQGEDGIATITGNGKSAEISDGRNFVPVDRKFILLQSPAKVFSGEYFVPIDFLTKVLPSLIDEEVLFRVRDRILVLGSDFPKIQVRSKPNPSFTRVSVESDRPVPMTFSEDEDAIRVYIDTPFLNTSFLGEDIRDEVVESITLNRKERSYVLAITVGNRFGALRNNSGDREDTTLVLDLVRSRVPHETRKSTEVWDLAEEKVEDGEQEVDDEKPNPNAEVLVLREDSHHLPSSSNVFPESKEDRLRAPEVRVVTLDPGHGGQEVGAEGQGGTFEKEVVLAVTKRFQKKLEERLGVSVILTRNEDRALSLDERAAIANSNKSNLFVSIHADASPRPQARGSTVYFLSHSSASNEAPIASPENLNFILWHMAQTSQLSQSAKLAEILQEELQAVTGSQQTNRGIKQNTFRVLRGAMMPAVLVELGFISNPKEEIQLTAPDYQERLAEALYRGIRRYKDLFENTGLLENAKRSPE